MVLMNIFAGQQWSCRHREQTCGQSEGRREWDELREYHGNIYYHMQVRQQVRTYCVKQGAQPSVV